MPAALANCTWHGHCKQDRKGCTGYWCTQCPLLPTRAPASLRPLTGVGLVAGNGNGVGPIVNPGHAKCSRDEMHYQGIKQPPPNNDYSGWHDLVAALAQHAVERYGLAEVSQWSFEVWVRCGRRPPFFSDQADVAVAGRMSSGACPFRSRTWHCSTRPLTRSRASRRR